MARVFFTIIGLIVQLAGSFLLAARGFEYASVAKVVFARRHWTVAAAPGVLTTSSFIACSWLLPSRSFPPVLLVVSSVVVAGAWVPVLAKHSLKYVDRAGVQVSDGKVHSLNIQGLALLAIGFILSALAAVLE
jgi:hypothetical protein